MPKVTIGVPVYNGEKFLEEKITSLLKQSFSDFEIIISDNASTDRTEKICRKFVEIDSRIKYFRQKKNVGFSSFLYILENAQGEYFFWTAVDDVILPEFIKKNVEILEQKKNVICSISQVKYFGEKTNRFKIKNDDNGFTKFRKKVYWYFSPLKNIPAEGKFEEKIRLYLKSRGHHHMFYGIFRTELLKKFIVKEQLVLNDLPTLLNGLVYGDYFVLDDVLMFRGDSGVTSEGFFSFKEKKEMSIISALFLNYPMTKWVLKKFGKKVFLKNLDLLLIWNLEGFFYLGVDIVRKIIIKRKN